MGYSNNSNYFGDWFGKGQIDFSKVINANGDGSVYIVKIWCGSGYILDVYLVKATDWIDAIDKVFEWSWEHEKQNNIIMDSEYIRKMAEEWFETDPDMFGDEYKDDYEQFEDRVFEDYVANSDYSLFARDENFFVDKVPEKYLKECA
jgi:hypothetical protein